MRVVGLAAALLILAGCGTADLIRATTEDSVFVLTATVPRTTFHPGDVIDVRATLEYVGRQPQVVVTADEAGPVAFAFMQLDGPLQMDTPSRLMCSGPLTLLRDTPLTYRPLKGGGWSDEDPNAVFYRSWVADPEVRLPAGTWQVVATSELYDGTSCGTTTDSRVLTAPPLVLRVVP